VQPEKLGRKSHDFAGTFYGDRTARMQATDCRTDLTFAPSMVCRCPICANALLYVHEYGPEIVPNGQRIAGLSASYVYRCPNHGLWHVLADGKALPCSLSSTAA